LPARLVDLARFADAPFFALGGFVSFVERLRGVGSYLGTDQRAVYLLFYLSRKNKYIS